MMKIIGTDEATPNAGIVVRNIRISMWLFGSLCQNLAYLLVPKSTLSTYKFKILKCAYHDCRTSYSPRCYPWFQILRMMLFWMYCTVYECRFIKIKCQHIFTNTGRAFFHSARNITSAINFNSAVSLAYFFSYSANLAFHSVSRATPSWLWRLQCLHRQKNKFKINKRCFIIILVPKSSYKL